MGFGRRHRQAEQQREEDHGCRRWIDIGADAAQALFGREVAADEPDRPVAGWPGPDGRAVPGTMPQWLAGLTRQGFDDSAFSGRVA